MTRKRDFLFGFFVQISELNEYKSREILVFYSFLLFYLYSRGFKITIYVEFLEMNERARHKF
jgi:hypothetical protein